MTTFTSTQIRLAARPQGWPTPQDFATESVEYADLQPGQVRVVNDFLSVDPYMRGRMSAARSYVKPYEVGETVTGGAVGRVVESAADDLPRGTLVLHQHGWTDRVSGPLPECAFEPALVRSAGAWNRRFPAFRKSADR